MGICGIHLPIEDESVTQETGRQARPMLFASRDRRRSRRAPAHGMKNRPPSRPSGRVIRPAIRFRENQRGEQQEEESTSQIRPECAGAVYDHAFAVRDHRVARGIPDLITRRMIGAQGRKLGN